MHLMTFNPQWCNEAATYITTQVDATSRPHLAGSLDIEVHLAEWSNKNEAPNRAIRGPLPALDYPM